MTAAVHDARRRSGLRGEDPVARVPGVGASRAAVYARLGVATVADLLRLAPRRFEDRRRVSRSSELLAGTSATFVGRVVRARTVRARGTLVIVEATLADEDGEIGRASCRERV